MRALVAALLLLPALAFGQVGTATITWTHDAQNLTGFRLYAGTSPTALTARQDYGAALRSAVWDVPAQGVWFFALSALNGATESVREGVVCRVVGGTGTCPPLPPGPVHNLNVTVLQTAPVTISLGAPTSNWEYSLVVPAGVVARLQLQPSTSYFDWVRTSTGATVTTTPALGGNGDGARSNVITLTGPVNGRTDIDGTVPPTGITATVNGVTKPFVLTGSTWLATFP